MFLKFLKWLNAIGEPDPEYDGTLADVATHLQRLIDAPDGWLRIELPTGEEHLLQFHANATIIEIDYPLVTPEQRRHETALRNVYAAAGVEPVETRDSADNRYLDCTVPANARAASILVERILRQVFGADASTTLRFVGELPALPEKQES